jgi:archaellum component FlaG (FlaF/FlaG flagellin family)
MKVQLNATAVIALAGIGVAAYMAYRGSKAISGVTQGISDSVSEAVNYVAEAPGKIYDSAASGLNSAGDWINNTGESITQARDDAFYYVLDNTPNQINPNSDQNLIYTGVNAAGEAVTGQKGWTLGGWLHDITH